MLKNKFILSGAIFLVIVGGYYWYKNSRNQNGEVRYVTEKAERGMIVSSISASGNIVVDQVANIDPTISGTVQELAVKVGDSVKKGQFLFSIENDDLGVSVSKAMVSLEQAKNSLESAELDIEDAEAKYDKTDDDSYSKKEEDVLEDKIDLAESKLIASRKNYEAAVLDYQNQKKEAAKRKVLATIDGTVNAVNIKNGDDLGKSSSSGSSEPPIIIGDLKTLKAEVQVNEVDITKVALGQKVILTLNAIENMETAGRVEKIDALGTSSSGVVSYDVTIAFDVLDQRIRPEMSVSASIITDTKQDVIAVSNSAIKSGESMNFVQLLVGGKAEDRMVETGVANNTRTEITKGLSEGDEVITQTIASTSSSNGNAKTTSSGSNTRMPSGSGVRIPGL